MIFGVFGRLCIFDLFLNSLLYEDFNSVAASSFVFLQTLPASKEMVCFMFEVKRRATGSIIFVGGETKK